MPRFLTPLLAFICLSLSAPCFASGSNKADGIQWRDFTDEAFAEAKRDGKLLILDLEAVWCHWCHVMEEKTYSDPDIIELIKENFIALKVDQDSRPDLSRRYQDWGWPATIFYNADGVEIVKRAGYINPDNMADLLQAMIDDPSPESGAPINAQKTFASSALLPESVREQLIKNHLQSYDPVYGSLAIGQKFIDRDTVEYAMREARAGDKQNETMARKTLDEAIALIDPAWGGVYQYSTGGKWDYPHFEKIMKSQAGYMRIYALAYSQWQDPKYLKAAEDIASYLNVFLTAPNGAFYTSQDADLVQGEHSREYFELGDKARRALGIPRIDKHMYSRETGQAAEAFAVLYAATGKSEYLQRAEKAVAWALKNRANKQGGFRHDDVDKGGPFLGDNLGMVQALIALYQVTGNRDYLKHATETLVYIDKTFRYGGAKDAGYAVSYAPVTAVIKPLPQIDENILVARLAIRIHHYTGEEKYKVIAERATRFLVTPAVATERLTEAGILLVAHELANDPTHITVVGKKDDSTAKALYITALRYPGSYQRIEWWDKQEGSMPNPDVRYPTLPRAAAFACSNQRCSLPVFEPKGIHDMVDILNGRGDQFNGLRL